MQLELFSFNKIQKSVKIIEEKLNSFLSDGKAFKFCSQSESTKSGKFFVSVFYENKESKVRAKVFKDSNHRNIQKQANEFLSGNVTMKWCSQSSTTNSIYMIVFYELRKESNGKEEENQNKR